MRKGQVPQVLPPQVLVTVTNFSTMQTKFLLLFLLPLVSASALFAFFVPGFHWPFSAGLHCRHWQWEVIFMWGEISSALLLLCHCSSTINCGY